VRHRVFLQVMEIDAGASKGVSFTPGLELDLGFDRQEETNGFPPPCRFLALSLLLSSSAFSLQAQHLERRIDRHLLNRRARRRPCASAGYPSPSSRTKGSSTSGLSFVARHGADHDLLHRDGFVLQLVSRERQEAMEEDCITGANVFFTFEGASARARVQGLEELPGRFNYFRGQDPAQWHTDVPTYQKIHYQELYPGIDLELKEGEPGASSMT
jgi:hypothetical protein